MHAVPVHIDQAGSSVSAARPRETLISVVFDISGCRQELSERVNLLWLCYDGVC
jgi:hypothetical protein